MTDMTFRRRRLPHQDVEGHPFFVTACLEGSDYIENNPVKAGLAALPEDYRWSSARIRKQLGLKPGHAIPKVA